MMAADAVRCMRRSSGGGGGGGELIVPDFTEFTEVDSGGYITVNSASMVSAENMPRNVDSYLYKDYGVDFFGNLTAEFTIDIKGFRRALTNPLIRCMVFANQVDDSFNIDDQVAVTIYYGNTSPNNLEVRATRYEAGVVSDAQAFTPFVGDIYYCKAVLTQTDFTVYLALSEIDRDAGIWAYSATVPINTPVNYRYFYPISSTNISYNGTCTMSIYDVSINNGV